MDKDNFQRYIDLFKPVMEAMHSLLGPQSEFILHDLSKPQSSVAFCVGDVTNRHIGAPLTNLVMDRLKAQGNQAEDMLDYLSLAKDGRQLKSSTVFIRNESGEIVGCLCYNLDLTELRLAQKVISGFTAIKSNSAQDAKGEIFAQEISDVVGDIIQYEITKTQKPVTLMSRGDKLRLISSLDAKGVFDVKGSAEMTAQFLGSSVFTVYNYLKEIRSAFKQGQ